MTPALATTIDPIEHTCHDVRRLRSDLMDHIRQAIDLKDRRTLDQLAAELRSLHEDFDALYVLALCASEDTQKEQ